MKNISEKVFLITGAAGGFGQEFTKQLLEKGSHLILTDINNEQLEKHSTEILKSIPLCKGKILGTFASDLSSKAGCEEAFNKARNISAAINVLINNAGLINYGAFHEIPMEKWEQLMQVNLMAPMYLSYHYMNAYIHKGSGHIVNISSVAGFVSTAYGATYSTSKFGLRSFGMALHAEAKEYGINVTNVYPFYSLTPMLNTKTEGSFSTPKTPGFLYSSPETIVSAAIKGMQKNKLHVYPGFISNFLYNAIKFWPIVGSLAK